MVATTTPIVVATVSHTGTVDKPNNEPAPVAIAVINGFEANWLRVNLIESLLMVLRITSNLLESWFLLKFTVKSMAVQTPKPTFVTKSPPFFAISLTPNFSINSLVAPK